MMTNIKIELTDEQRRTLQQQLTGKVRLISRSELTEFVDGVIEGALKCEALVAGVTLPHRGRIDPNPELTVIPKKYREAYANRPAHWKAGWLRGWNLVGRSMK